MCAISSIRSKTCGAKGNPKRYNRGSGQGRLIIAGIGPGDVNLLSRKTADAIKKSQVIVGYKTYIKLLGNLIKGKEIASFGMTQEVDRARFAIQRASKGENVLVVSSGDPGVYGMAGVVLELLNKSQTNKIKVEIIPGIIAATASASLLGAPLMHDFVSISLSDLLTDLKLIKRRIKLASQGDFVIVLYNPKGKKRTKPFREAWQILMKYKSPDTPAGIVRNATRDNEEVVITTLKNMIHVKNIDMVSTLIIGNSETYVKNGRMITPRGYNL